MSNSKITENDLIIKDIYIKNGIEKLVLVSFCIVDSIKYCIFYNLTKNNYETPIKINNNFNISSLNISKSENNISSEIFNKLYIKLLDDEEYEEDEVQCFNTFSEISEIVTINDIIIGNIYKISQYYLVLVSFYMIDSEKYCLFYNLSEKKYQSYLIETFLENIYLYKIYKEKLPNINKNIYDQSNIIDYIKNSVQQHMSNKIKIKVISLNKNNKSLVFTVGNVEYKYDIVFYNNFNNIHKVNKMKEKISLTENQKEILHESPNNVMKKFPKNTKVKWYSPKNKETKYGKITTSQKNGKTFFLSKNGKLKFYIQKINEKNKPIKTNVNYGISAKLLELF